MESSEADSEMCNREFALGARTELQPQDQQGIDEGTSPSRRTHLRPLALSVSVFDQKCIQTAVISHVDHEIGDSGRLKLVNGSRDINRELCVIP